MDMDFILPDELTTEKMRLEYEKMLKGKDTSVLSLDLERPVKNHENSEKSIVIFISFTIHSFLNFNLSIFFPPRFTPIKPFKIFMFLNIFNRKP